MKWINPGVMTVFHSATGTQLIKQTSDITSTGYAIAGDDNVGVSKLVLNIPETEELWVSFDVCRLHYNTANGYGGCFGLIDTDGLQLPFIEWSFNGSTTPFKVSKATDAYWWKNSYETYGQQKYKKILYSSDKDALISDKKPHNIELHVKCGENGRIDLWVDTKLFLSYRSPSEFNGKITKFIIKADTFSYWTTSSFILQDTSRIGLEKFKKLTIDPDTEQNMPQGSTTTYKLSGLSDATEFSDITSVCAVLQATSRDANISTGTFSLDGNEIGMIDVSDSSGKAYEIAHSETNSTTGKSWTVADIEEKTLSFKVNGAE